MKNKLIFRMFIILFITVIVVTGGVLAIVYVMTYNAMMDDINHRATGVKEYILDSLYADDLVDIGIDSPEGINTSLLVQDIHERFKGVGSLSRLYIAREDETGRILTTLCILPGDDFGYIPAGILEADLRRSLRDNIAVMGDGIYRTDTGDVYTIFWPVGDRENQLIGAVCMEFDVNMINMTRRQTTLFSVALSGALLVLFSVVAYLSMNRATEPFYKKLAYTDILTGYENRMAFEHKLRECGDLAEQGTSVSMIICDVNNLKIINDNIGHDAGDAYIQNTADLIFENLGGKQPLYRIGGDEFASVLVGKKESEILVIMQSLANEKRSAYKTQPFSCACGFAMFDGETDEDLRDTFKRADEAMYVEKKRQKGLL